MFVNAIERVAEFTRPIHFLTRNYGATAGTAGAATLFFVNDKGWALTCAHVAKEVLAADSVGKKYQAFKAELAAGRGKIKEKVLVKQLEKQYGYSKEAVIEMHVRFMDCVEGLNGIEVKIHPTIDIALLKFVNYTRLTCTQFPMFPSSIDAMKQGKMICRLGFPFPEFSNFSFDNAADSLHWNDQGRNVTPRFPIEGMVTRLVGASGGTPVGFELSTPGLRGQSGGPAFDTDGTIWGIQSQTMHLDLNFDVNQEVDRMGVKKHVKDSAFLHVGRCVHINEIKSFLAAHNVEFQEQ